MKKILYNLATVALLIFLILKLLVDYCKVPSIYITVGGMVLTLLYCIYFSKKYTIMRFNLKGLCLLILVYNSLITVAINASTVVSNLVIFNDKFMYMVILAKWSYLISNFYFAYRAYVSKKHRCLATIYILVAYFNILEMFLSIEAVLEFLAVILDYGLEKYGRINNIQKKIDK